MKKYEMLEMEVLFFLEDVVTASNTGDVGTNDDDEKNWTKNY